MKTGAGAWGSGGSHSVTSSPGLCGRASKEPSLMARNTPPPFRVLAPSGLGLNWRGRGRSDCECGHGRLLPRSHPPTLSCVQPSPQPYRAPKCLCQAVLFRTSVSALTEGWVGVWRKPPPLKLAGFTYRQTPWGWGKMGRLVAGVRVEVGAGGFLGL